ncbi:CDP-alcohol phosphatidyltransferase family protein [Micrococcales bacterium 31B]|nr:CDP-alcohol phosphatidyltransferase family protein [Micrococcales bacterium 31B]
MVQMLAMQRAFNYANAVTTVRAVLVVALIVPLFQWLTAAEADPGRTSGVPLAVALVALLAVALDGVDGWVARRLHCVTEFGARYDMEVDAALILLLCLPAARLLGGWVLLIGFARYLWIFLTVLFPRLATPVPSHRWRKAVAVLQALALVVAIAEITPRAAAVTLLAGALAALALSFGTQAIEALRLSRGAVPARGAARTGAAVPTRAEVPGRASEASEITTEITVSKGAAKPAGWRTGIAVALLWAVFTWPRSGPLTVDALLRVPAEALALGVVAVWLPLPRGRWGRGIARGGALIVGLALTVVVLLHGLDFGFSQAFDRPFDARSDYGYAQSAFDLLGDAVGRAGAIALLAVGALAVAALAWALTWSVLHVASLLATRRERGRPVVAIAAAAWLVVFAGSVTPVPGLPVASHSTVNLVADHVGRWTAAATDERTFGRVIEADPAAREPATALVGGLAGTDVLVIFVESYGRVALEDSPVAATVGRTLDASTATLADHGYASRSGYLTSPTFGGLSWLAHATLHTGLPVTSQRRYDQLLATRHSTLTGIFADAGWRTVCVDPANRSPWPPAREFYRCDAVYDATSLGYEGPRLGYPSVPDQFTLHAFAQRELTPGHAPVMAAVDLVSSHTPWSPIPPMLPVSALGDGSIYGRLDLSGSKVADVHDAAQETEGYGRGIRYSLEAVTQFLADLDDPNLVVVMLGDHQPNALVSGEGASRDVPVSIIASDPAQLDRIAGWGWSSGLRPAPDAPVVPMAAFRERFFEAYGG